MKILLVCRSFPHHRAGGLEWTSQDLLEGLIAAGHTVSVITTSLPSEPALRELRCNGRLITFGSQSGRYSLAFFADLRRSIRGIVQSEGIDVIHSQGFAGIAIPRDLPNVTTIHGTLWSETPLRHGGGLRLRWRFKHRYLFQPLWQRFLREGRLITVDSDFTREELAREAPGLSAETVRTVPLGFDLTRFPSMTRAEARRELGLPQDAKICVGIARLEAIKRPDWLVAGFAALANQIPNALLILAGAGPERDGLVAAAKPFGERVQLPGIIPADRLPVFLAAADWFLNADHGSPAFGLTNAEALVMGTPVLATDSGAHREVVRDSDGDGAIVPLDDLDSWKASMARVLRREPEDDSVRLVRMVRSRQRFSRDRMVADYLKVYEEARSAARRR